MQDLGTNYSYNINVFLISLSGIIINLAKLKFWYPSDLSAR